MEFVRCPYCTFPISEKKVAQHVRACRLLSSSLQLNEHAREKLRADYQLIERRIQRRNKQRGQKQ